MNVAIASALSQPATPSPAHLAQLPFKAQRMTHIEFQEANRLLKGAAFQLFVNLCYFAADKGFCWHSLKSLIKKTSLSKPAIIEAKKKLVDAGFIRVLSKDEHGQSYESDQYVLLKALPFMAQRERSDEGVKNSDQGGSENLTGGVKNSDPKYSKLNTSNIKGEEEARERASFPSEIAQEVNQELQGLIIYQADDVSKAVENELIKSVHPEMLLTTWKEIAFPAKAKLIKLAAQNTRDGLAAGKVRNKSANIIHGIVRGLSDGAHLDAPTVPQKPTAPEMSVMERRTRSMLCDQWLRDGVYRDPREAEAASLALSLEDVKKELGMKA